MTKELKRFNRGGKRIAFCIDLFLIGFTLGIGMIAITQQWKVYFFLQCAGFPIMLFRLLFPLPLMLYSTILKDKGRTIEAKKWEYFVGGLYYANGSVLEED